MNVYYVPEGFQKGRNVYALSDRLNEAVLGKGFILSKGETTNNINDFIIAYEEGFALSLPGGSISHADHFDIRNSLKFQKVNIFESIFDLVFYENIAADLNEYLIIQTKGERFVILKEDVQVHEFINNYFPITFYFKQNNKLFYDLQEYIKEKGKQLLSNDLGRVFSINLEPRDIRRKAVTMQEYIQKSISVCRLVNLLSDNMLNHLGSLIGVTNLSKHARNLPKCPEIIGALTAKGLAYLLDFVPMLLEYYIVPDDLVIKVSEGVYKRATFVHARFNKELSKPEKKVRYVVNKEHLLWYITIKVPVPCKGDIASQLKNRKCLRDVLSGLNILDRMLNIFNEEFFRKLKQIYSNKDALSRHLLNYALIHKAAMYISLLDYLQQQKALEGYPDIDKVSTEIFGTKFVVDRHPGMYLPVFLVLLGKDDLARDLYKEAVNIIEKLGNYYIGAYKIRDALDDTDIQTLLLLEPTARYPLISAIVDKEKLAKAYSEISKYVDSFSVDINDDYVIKSASYMLDELKQLSNKIDKWVEEVNKEEDEEDFKL